jgi:LPXTG-site transpeptidase (sortase) family protein
MKVKNIPKQIVLPLSLMFIIVGFFTYSVLLVIDGDKNFAENYSTPFIQTAFSLPSKTESRSSLPVRLKIPKINVNTAIESVGLTKDGAMDVPKGPVDVAWFKFGPRPGEIGNAVISGHFGWKDNIPAVFDNLYQLRNGDKIYIKDETGTTTVFVVREIRSFDPNADAKDVFISTDGKAHLNLVTCEGVWNKTQKSYSKRLVVFTDKI